MNMNEMHKSIEKIGSLSITTLDGNTMHSRVISLCDGDEDGIYFLTMAEAAFRSVREMPLNCQKRFKLVFFERDNFFA
jgi:hypothetical protein